MVMGQPAEKDLAVLLVLWGILVAQDPVVVVLVVEGEAQRAGLLFSPELRLLEEQNQVVALDMVYIGGKGPDRVVHLVEIGDYLVDRVQHRVHPQQMGVSTSPI